MEKHSDYITALGLLQRLYDNANATTNEYGEVSNWWIDTIDYSDLEGFLYQKSAEYSLYDEAIKGETL